MVMTGVQYLNPFILQSQCDLRGFLERWGVVAADSRCDSFTAVHLCTQPRGQIVLDIPDLLIRLPQHSAEAGHRQIDRDGNLVVGVVVVTLEKDWQPFVGVLADNRSSALDSSPCYYGQSTHGNLPGEV